MQALRSLLTEDVIRRALEAAKEIGLNVAGYMPEAVPCPDPT